MEWRRPEVGSRARLSPSRGESAGKPPPGPKGQPRRGRQNGRLRTPVRCAIIPFIAHLLCLGILPPSPFWRSAHDHHSQRPADRPTRARVPAGPARRRPGRGRRPGVRPLRQHQAYGTQWKLFTDWCDEVGLTPLPAEPLTVARYLAARAGDGASVATMRLAASAITKAHEWEKLE